MINADEEWCGHLYNIERGLFRYPVAPPSSSSSSSSRPETRKFYRVRGIFRVNRIGDGDGENNTRSLELIGLYGIHTVRRREIRRYMHRPGRRRVDEPSRKRNRNRKIKTNFFF